MKQYVQVSIPVTQEETSNILVAQLGDMQYEAFEETEGLLKAFIPQDAFDETSLQMLMSEYGLSYRAEVLPVTNWNTEWEKNFQPVTIDDFCAVRAGFHQPVTSVQHEIVITPKMSFGTGHHATTAMMIQLMRTVDFRGKYVFDFGTGTGILAILADKLGAKEVLAIDNDDWSMSNAAENMAANHCSSIRLQNAGNIPLHQSFDIIMANINKHVIVETFHTMHKQLSTGGVMLLSGLLQTDADDINAMAISCGLMFRQQYSNLGWIALRYDKS
ncbi:MAG TPA: 50S ribosomal protein L11 methyltransferase [Chitinophagaceae bacterium]|nr:50S ribosomal protein L11 methyltransferase [Chitinophagaceae bacterium]